ncbi:MAG: hypothetical protein HDR03_06880 [Lachnospiraceae bacterium]|nr:hypothetical protein [Lachnospiraceae bacterium]
MNSKSVKEGGKHNMYSKSKRFIASFLAVLMAVCMLPVDMLGGVGVAYAAAGDITASPASDDSNTEFVTGTNVSITLSIEEGNASDIYYLVKPDSETDKYDAIANGTAKDADDGSTNGSSLTLNKTTTFKAFTVDGEGKYANVQEFDYTFTAPTKPTVTANPDGTSKYTFTDATGEVVLSASAGSVYYVLSTDEDYTTTSVSAEAIVTKAQEATGAITITKATTIKAVAKDNDNVGEVQTFEYDVTPDTVTVGTITPSTAAGAVAKDTEITLSYTPVASESAEIYCTTTADSKPDAATLAVDANKYTEGDKIKISANTTIYAVAKVGTTYGEVQTFAYTIDDGTPQTKDVVYKLNGDEVGAAIDGYNGSQVDISGTTVGTSNYFTMGKKTGKTVAVKYISDVASYTWDESIAEADRTTSAIWATGGALGAGDADGYAANGITFTTTTANAKLRIYAAPKQAANLVVAKGSAGGTKIVDESFTAFKISAANGGNDITLAEPDIYYVGFSGGGGIFPCITVTETKTISDTPEAPKAVPDSAKGAVNEGTKVTLNWDDEDATVYYTIGATDTDTKDPKEAESGKIEYTAGAELTIDADHKVIKAYAEKGGKSSDTIKFEYTLKAAKPTATPENIVLGADDKVELHTTTTVAGTEIRFTTDGTEPTATSTLYTEALDLTVTTPIKAITIKEGWESSEVAEFIYVVPTTTKSEKIADGSADALDSYFTMVDSVKLGNISSISQLKDDLTNWDAFDVEGVSKPMTKAILSSSGSMPSEGSAPANCITFTTSAANGTKVVAYFATKAETEAALTIAKWDAGKIGETVSSQVGGSAEAKGNTKITKAEFTLTDAGTYCIGFVGGKTGTNGVGGGIIPYMIVTENPGGGSTEPTTVADPVFAPALTEGKHTFGTKTGEVTITCATTGAKIYYVTNKGTNALTDAELEAVTEENILDNVKKQEYGTAISVTESGTKFKAIAVYTKSDSTTINSGIISAEYDITENGYDVTANPTADPTSGTINVNDTISLSADTGAKIRYTTDGTTEPTATTGEEYSDTNKPTATAVGPFSVKAIAYKTETVDGTETVTAISSVVTFNYTVTEAGTPVALTSVTLTGEAKVGSTLTATPVFTGGTPDNSKVAYAWYHVGSTEPISGANAATYEVKKSDVGYKIKVVVTYDGDAASAQTAETSATVTEDNGGDGGDENVPKTGIAIKFDEGSTYIYTGAKITPSITVYNNGTPLVEGTDYTVKYTNNVNASHTVGEDDALTAAVAEKKLPTVTVTGKGSLSKKVTANFKIVPKALDNDDYESAANAETVAKVIAGASAVENKKATPVLLYGGVKLAVKKNFEYDDTTQQNKNDWGGEDSPLLKLSGVNNFMGSIEIPVSVVTKADQANAKIKAEFKNGEITGKDAVKNLYYNGTPYVIGFDVSTKGGLSNAEDAEDPLVENTDYVISYPEDLTNVGAKKVTITGISSRCTGSVTKSYKVIAADKTGGKFVVDGVDTVNGYDFVSTGVTFDLTGDDAVTVKYVANSSEGTDSQAVSADGELVPGKDFKITYSNNKKVGTAKYTVTGLGNYKGVVLKNQEFTINGIGLTNQNDDIDVTVADVFYNKKGSYKSVPYVTVNGKLLKASEYVAYYTVEGDDESEVKGKTRNITDEDFANDATSLTVTVTIEAKGKNVVGPDESKQETKKTATFNIIKKADGYDKSKDLSKAKITFYGGETKNKVGYTGKAVYPTKMEIKLGSTVETVDLNATGQPTDATKKYTIVYADNVAKGKATAVVTADAESDYVGGKAATFNIVQKALDSLDTENGEGFIITSFMKGLFSK